MIKNLTSLYGGNRNYRIDTKKLSSCLDDNSKLTMFEKHLIQEGVKQILFGSGTEEIIDSDTSTCIRIVPEEMIDFLFNYEVIKTINNV